MAMTKEQILAEALSLPPRDRESLAERIWLSVDQSDAAQVEAEWAQEAERRLDAVERGEAAVFPAEQVMREIRDELGL